MLYALLALVSAVAAAFSFIKYTSSNDNKLFLIIALVCAVLAVGLGGVFLAGRMGRKEDIHITE